MFCRSNRLYYQYNVWDVLIYKGKKKQLFYSLTYGVWLVREKAKGLQNEGSLLLQNGLPNLSHMLAEEGFF